LIDMFLTLKPRLSPGIISQKASCCISRLYFSSEINWSKHDCHAPLTAQDTTNCHQFFRHPTGTDARARRVDKF
jgi:hypothetical protein